MAIAEELLARLGEKEKWIAVLEESVAESEIELHRSAGESSRTGVAQKLGHL